MDGHGDLRWAQERCPALLPAGTKPQAPCFPRMDAAPPTSVPEIQIQPCPGTLRTPSQGCYGKEGSRTPPWKPRGLAKLEIHIISWDTAPGQLPMSKS